MSSITDFVKSTRLSITTERNSPHAPLAPVTAACQVLTGFDDLDGFAYHMSKKANYAVGVVRFLTDAKSSER